MKDQVLEVLRYAISELEAGRARGCFVACFGPEDEDLFSISACDPGIRDLVVAEAEAMLASIKQASDKSMQ
jgi:hypothetical protein